MPCQAGHFTFCTITRPHASDKGEGFFFIFADDPHPKSKN